MGMGMTFDVSDLLAGGEKQVPFDFAQGRLSRQKKGARNDKHFTTCGNHGKRFINTRES
jgi:hypothetical protein